MELGAPLRSKLGEELGTPFGVRLGEELGTPLGTPLGVRLYWRLLAKFLTPKLYSGKPTWDGANLHLEYLLVGITAFVRESWSNHTM